MAHSKILPPKTAEICRQKSVEFEELAKQLGNPGWAEQFWKLAEQWRQLADQIECYDLEKINPNPPAATRAVDGTF
jgi:hypothetical protein